MDSWLAPEKEICIRNPYSAGILVFHCYNIKFNGFKILKLSSVFISNLHIHNNAQFSPSLSNSRKFVLKDENFTVATPLRGSPQYVNYKEGPSNLSDLDEDPLKSEFFYSRRCPTAGIEMRKQSQNQWKTADNAGGSSTLVQERTLLESQHLNQPKPPCPGTYEPKCNIQREKKPRISVRFKHMHEPGRIEDPEVAREVERQLEEQLYHGFSHLTQPDCFHRHSAQASKSRPSQATWNLSREPQCAVKTKTFSCKKERIRKNSSARGRPEVTIDGPSWVHSAEHCQDVSRGALPKWATDEALCSPDHYGWPALQLRENEEVKEETESPPRKHLTFSPLREEEKVDIPSWAQQVTVNTLNETIIFKDEALSPKNNAQLKRRMSHSSSVTGTYLNSLPDWVRHEGNEEAYLDTLPNWVNNLESSGDSKYDFNINEKIKSNVKTFFISDRNFKKSSIPRKSAPDTRFTRKKETVHICKGQELISSLTKSPIETFDKLMAYLMTAEAVDEEDITGVENFDECDSKPLAWSEGDNFLAFIKEKHLIQGIEYCNIAIQQTIKHHINGIKMKRELGLDNKSKPKVKEHVLNSIRASAIKEIHQEDEQIEVIGYVGCTVGNKVNTTPKVCKQDVPSEPQEDEVKEI